MSDSPVSRGLSLLAAIAWLPLPGSVSTVFERALYELRLLEAAYERQAKELRFQRERAEHWNQCADKINSELTRLALRRIVNLEHELVIARKQASMAVAAQLAPYMKAPCAIVGCNHGAAVHGYDGCNICECCLYKAPDVVPVGIGDRMKPAPGRPGDDVEGTVASRHDDGRWVLRDLASNRGLGLWTEEQLNDPALFVRIARDLGIEVAPKDGKAS